MPDAADSAELGARVRSDFPIVGVGASAGGLEAFTQLLRALPSDTGMAFVLVQHLAPSHVSALAEILGRATPMPVQEARDHERVEPDRVYVIPPGQDMIIRGGELQLLPRTTSGQHRPVDLFFRTLAAERGQHALAVVLSGTASDGTLGVESIKAEGGITFAQDESAQHDGMPSSAIASRCVDFVLPPEEIAREIVRIGRQRREMPDEASHETGGLAKLAPVLQEVLKVTGVDFTYYKYGTLQRRIHRRMLLQRIGSLEDYAQRLRDDPAEVDALYQDILINVTSFFRDPEAFEVLTAKVFPRLLKDRARSEPVRMWVLGCSTGQEAYSLAIAFTEFSSTVGSSVPLQIFATDLNASAVERARAGVYSAEALQDMSPERLQRFFVPANGGYRIAKSIRDCCVFSRHDGLVDPPFSRIDLISCRNLLIYLEPVLQQRLVPTLHFALKPTGALWLGGSESLGAYQNLFEVEDAKERIYLKKAGTKLHRAPRQRSEARSSTFAPALVRAADGAANLPREADRLLLARFAPPSVLVSADLEILQYRGATAPYLAPAPGKASLSLLKMLRPGLLVPVRAAIQRAERGDSPAREEGLRFESDGAYREIAVEALRVRPEGPGSAAFLILFEEGGSREAQSAPPSTAAAPPELQTVALENARLAEQLAATREYLQSVIEQHDVANEELQSAAEEAQSANEELQSMNEELETSKEEIQSSNEELAIVNDEMHNRNAELNRLNADLMNLLGNVQMAIVMLGPDLRIRRFTGAAEVLLDLRPGDVGRPIGDLRLGVALPDLDALLAEVIRSGSVPDQEVRSSQGRWYSLRLRPYRTLENAIDGVILMLVDVDLLKREGETERVRSASLLEADHRKDEFLAILAHELRNPLAPIRNALSILELSVDPHTVALTREMMQRQVEHLVRLVDDLLDVSRIATGKIDLRNERLELGELVSRSVEVARPAFKVMELSLELSLPPERVYVYGDEARLSQVVENLLTNACKFTDKGGRVWLTVGREDDQAVLRVHDNGIGLGADQLDRIFDMFIQVDASIERSRSGLGIGLTLVRILVALHAGTVEVHSAGVDQGSEFVVRLPLFRSGRDASPPGPAASEAAAPAPRRILVVDDNRDSAESLAILLRLAGHQTRTAFDGLEALEVAREFNPEVILLDLGLPKLNGFEVARKLREEPWGRDIVLVAMTGWGQDDDRRRTRDAGFDAHLVKPVDRKELAKLLAAP